VQLALKYKLVIVKNCTIPSRNFEESIEKNLLLTVVEDFLWA
jgi:hypothetical protein